jgi:alpha-ketoglutarate-dependent taurine dioxygenase
MAELAEPTIEQLREELKCVLFKAQTAAADTEQLTERNRKLEDALATTQSLMAEMH